jgi:hypothetical protein
MGGEVSRILLRLPVDIPFGDFMSRVCARMGLDPRNASLGYKYVGRDPRRSPWHALANEENLRAAMDRGVGYIRRARKHRMILEIENLVRIVLSSLLIRRLICVLATSSSYSSGPEGSQTRSR